MNLITVFGFFCLVISVYYLFKIWYEGKGLSEPAEV